MLLKASRSSSLLLLILGGCVSPQYRALGALVEAPLVPLPRYDALGSRAPLTPSAEQWALYEEVGPRGRNLLTAVLIGGGKGWQVELTRRFPDRVERHIMPLNRGNDIFLRMRQSDQMAIVDGATKVPAGRFIGAVAQDRQSYHPRVPIHGLLRGQNTTGTRWILLRFGLDKPPISR